jgi:hypothetical protein
MYVIYDHPRDYPDCFVVRKWEIAGEVGKPTNIFNTAPSLEEARKLVPPFFHQIDRHEADDPAIVEVWL